MNDTIAVAVAAGLGAMLGWGFADFFAKKTIDVIGDIQSLVLGHSIGAGLVFALLFTGGIYGDSNRTLPSETSEWLGLAFFGVLEALVYLLVYIGFGKGKLAVLNPVFSSYSGFVALISIIFLGEVVGSVLAIGLGVVFLGMMLISLEGKGMRLKSIRLSKLAGLNEILVATVLAAVWTILWSEFVDGKDGRLYGGLMYIAMTLALYIYAIVRKVKVHNVTPKIWLLAACIGVAEVVAYVAISIGFSETSRVSIVAVLSGAFSLPVIILSYIFLKEKVDRTHRIGSFVILVGVVIVSLAKY